MLNGIGGRTVEEAKERMTYAEYLGWCEFVRRHGSLNTGTRLEHGFAMLATVISRVHGGKANVEDFIPRYNSKLEAHPADINTVFQMLKATVKKGAKNGVA